MKKTSTKVSAKSSASDAPSGKKAAAKKSPVAAKPAKSVKAPAAKAPKAEKPAPAKQPKVFPKTNVTPAPVTTTIVAAIDVGFGNQLTLRGEGPGLSWDKGVVMECIADDRWSIVLPELTQPIQCKFLINDLTWCVGENYTVLPGSNVVFSPRF